MLSAPIRYQQGLALTVPSRPGNGRFQFIFPAQAYANDTAQYSTTLTNWVDLLTFSGTEDPTTVVHTTRLEATRGINARKPGRDG